MDFNQFALPAQVRYFSLGRFALAAALKSLEIKPGASVLLPEFICRDVLAAIHSVGGVPVFYPVSTTLTPASMPQSWPDAAAVIAVNFFGFPQNLAPFHAYCERTGARLIEDNAHGFLSGDSTSKALGLRAEIGIFSLRKTIPMVDGAALVVCNPELAQRLEPPLPFVRQSGGAAFRIKRGLSRLPWLGAPLLRVAVMLTRWLRFLRTGSPIPVSGDEVEISILGNPAAHEELLGMLRGLNASDEIKRRRALFEEVAACLKTTGVIPVYPELEPNVVPYGYPFFADETSVSRARRALRPLGLECFRWPELPRALARSAPAHYRNVWLVNFISRKL